MCLINTEQKKAAANGKPKPTSKSPKKANTANNKNVSLFCVLEETVWLGDARMTNVVIAPIGWQSQRISISQNMRLSQN